MGKEACISPRENNTDKDKAKNNHSMKVKSREACKCGKQHLYREVAEGEMLKQAGCASH